MPYKISKVKNKKCYKVIVIKSGKVLSKCSTLKNAKAQVRLLHSKERKK